MMQRRSAMLLLAVLLSLLIAPLAIVRQSFAAPAAQVIQPTGPATEPIDVVVVLDDSGSMATCWPWPQEGLPFDPPCRWPSENPPSDPEELRYSAARLLVHLADDADRLAVIRFDSGAEGVGALGTLQEAGSSERRRILAASLQPPTDYLARGYTRLDLGLIEAARILDENRQPNRNQYVLLLTDGEPTAPASAAGIRGRIGEQIRQLQDDGVLVFPVVLCNPSAGCAGEFLAEQFGPDVREAQTSSDLLRVFSELFAEMKADRSVVTARNASGDLAFHTRPPQGVGQVAFVSPKAALTAVQLNDTPVATRSLLEDGNIDLNVVEGEIPAGQWIAQTSDPSAFSVVQADSYPELLFPPPSALNSPASVRYHPAGKPPLIVARGVGPAAGEPLLLDGQTRMPSMGSEGNLAAMPLPSAADEITLQLGEDQSPLILRRSFRLEGRSDLPRAEVFSPTPGDPGLLADGRARLEVGFGPGAPVEELQAMAFVSDVTEEEGVPVYQATMNCVERMCSDEGFSPQDGRSYSVRYLITGHAADVRFGDWADAALDVEPAVYLRGVPATLDLNQMPLDGWPVSVVASTTEEIGTLQATLDLRREETGDPVSETTINFSVDVPEEGAEDALLRVQGIDRLRPGAYVGEITLQAFDPSGRSMDVKIRPAPVLPVTLRVERSVARVESQLADFGEVPFSVSPNFRIDEEILLPVQFERGNPFRLTAELAEGSCAGLRLTSGDLQQTEAGYALPLRLQSAGAVDPGACSGTIRLSGPNEDFDVFPSTLDARLRVRGLEWSVVGELNFGDLGLAGERSTRTLLMRFDGETPFTVRMLGIDASGRTDSGVVELNETWIEMPPVEVTGDPNENGYYEVPITLAARDAIPLDPVRGSFYSGDLVLGIEGLPNQTRSVDVAFRSPSLYQRYVEWWLAPIYSLPLLLCTGPLTLLLLLIGLARVRGGGSIYEEEEPVVTLPQPEFATRPESAFVTPSFESTGSAAGGASDWDSSWGGSVAWGSGSDGGAGNGTSEPDGVATAAPNRNGTARGATSDDPWSSSW